MKILHTSDWHLGHVLYGYDRIVEQTAMMKQMCNFIESERPDVFLICGDVFHTSAPGMEIQRLFSEALLSFHATKPDMPIIIISGNHDSGTRLEIFRQLWGVVDVTMIGHIDIEHPENHIVEIKDKGYVIAVPYAYERLIKKEFFESLQRKVSGMNVNGLPVVMAAHTTVSGCDFKGHANSTECTVGGIDSMPAELFGNGYDYLALGHIHRSQNIYSGEGKSAGCKTMIRYSGTPLAVSFDESYPHTVSIVEIASCGKEPVIRELMVDNPRPLVTLPAQGSITLDEALARLRSFDADSEAYIRLNVKVDGFLPPTANADAVAATDGKRCRFCLINPQRADASVSGDSEPVRMTVTELQKTDPSEIARRYAERRGMSFDEELFKEAMNAVVGC